MYCFDVNRRQVRCLCWQVFLTVDCSIYGHKLTFITGLCCPTNVHWPPKAQYSQLPSFMTTYLIYSSHLCFPVCVYDRMIRFDCTDSYEKTLSIQVSLPLRSLCLKWTIIRNGFVSPSSLLLGFLSPKSYRLPKFTASGKMTVHALVSTNFRLLLGNIS